MTPGQIHWQQELTVSLQEAADEILKKKPEAATRFRISGSLLVDAFFKRWYSSTTFIFRKNIKVTNVQFRELLSLIKLHSSNGAHGEALQSDHVLYQTSKEMKATFCRLWDTIYVNSKTDDDVTRERQKCEKLVSTYPEFFFDTILADGFCGSAQVHRPRCMRLDLEAICGESGYIYCCGTTIYMRRPAKVAVSVLKKKISEYLSSLEDKEEKIPFIVFSREQFPTHSVEDVRRSEHNGLDDLKFHMDKFYFGDAPVSDLHRSLFLADVPKSGEKQGEEFDQSIISKKAFYWRDRHNSERRSTGSPLEKVKRSIFLMMDRPMKLGEPSSPAHRFFLCFAQEVTNRSQFIEFEESKPGWTAPATIPHSLCAAMLNIARAGLDRHDRVTQRKSLRILDLFCGSGTTMLEASKYAELDRFLGVDKYALNQQASFDNLNFFQLPLEQKQELYRAVKEGILSDAEPLAVWRFNPLSTPEGTEAAVAFNKFRKFSEGDWSPEVSKTTDENLTIQNRMRWAFQVASHEFDVAKSEWVGDHSFNMFRTLSSHEIKSPMLTKLTSKHFSLQARLMFYACWKALLTNAYDLWAISELNDDEVTENYDALRYRLAFNEIGKMLVRLNRMIWIELSPEAVEHQPLRSVSSNLIINKGLYSRKTSVRIPDGCEKLKYLCEDLNSLELNPEEKFNIIVTDPPYGFNVSGENERLPDLYRKMMTVMLGHIEDGGQILFCVPQAPMNGQNIPFYMTSEFIVKQFILMATHVGKKLVDPVIKYPGGASVPSSDHYFRPPYYWESERALRRAVLHFQVFENNST